MTKYAIWTEGFALNGQRGTAMCHTHIEAESFREACEKWAQNSEIKINFNSERLSVWGCGLFDNEADARRTFG